MESHTTIHFCTVVCVLAKEKNAYMDWTIAAMWSLDNHQTSPETYFNPIASETSLRAKEPLI